MAEWLIEHKHLVYSLLGIAAVAVFALWWRSRKRHFLIALAVAVVLILGMVGIDRAVETDNEQMVRKVQEVAAAISANNLDTAFDHVSASFDRPPRKKQQFRELCERFRRTGQVTDVQVWDLTPVDPPPGGGAVEFRFKVRGSWGESPPNYFGRVVFVRDPDRQWRVKSFDVFDSMNQSRTPVPIQGW